MSNEADKGAWWVAGNEVHIDIPRLLKNCGMPDTEETRKLAVKVVLEVAVKELPRRALVIIEDYERRRSDG